MNNENKYKFEVTKKSILEKSIKRDPFLKYLTDEELDALEVLAKKSMRIVENAKPT